MAIYDDINEQTLLRLTMNDARAMVDVYSDTNCHHRPSDVQHGDPTYYLDNCSACWRAVWPLVLLVDARHDQVIRRELAGIVNGTVDAAITALRERWYVTPAGGRAPSMQDRQRERSLNDLRL